MITDELFNALRALIGAVEHDLAVKGEPATERLARELRWARRVVSAEEAAR